MNYKRNILLFPAILYIQYILLGVFAFCMAQQSSSNNDTDAEVTAYGSEHAFILAANLIAGRDEDSDLKVFFEKKRKEYLNLIYTRYESLLPTGSMLNFDQQKLARDSEVVCPNDKFCEVVGLPLNANQQQLLNATLSHGLNEQTATALSPDFEDVSKKFQLRQIPIALSILRNNISKGHLPSMVFLAQFLARNDDPFYQLRSMDGFVSPNNLDWKNYNLLFSSERFRSEGVWVGDKDINAAIDLLKKAADGGLQTALYYEAMLCQSDPDKAISLLEQSFTAGDLVSGFTLAHLYSTGMLWNVDQSSHINRAHAVAVLHACETRIKKFSFNSSQSDGLYQPGCDSGLQQELDQTLGALRNEAMSKISADEMLTVHQWDNQYASLGADLSKFVMPKIPYQTGSKNQMTCHQLAEQLSTMFPSGLLKTAADSPLSQLTYHISESINNFEFEFPCTDGLVAYQIDNKSYFVRNVPQFNFAAFQAQ